MSASKLLHDRAFHLANVISIIAAFLAFLQFFLNVEDGAVLFHRANYSTLTVPFYYAGYISLYPQVISYTLQIFSPFIQASIYSVVSLSIWILLIYKMKRIGVPGYLILVFCSYFIVFDGIYLYNLTFSFWPGLMVIGIAISIAINEDRPLKPHEVLVAAVLSTGSPLSILFSPSALFLAVKFPKSIASWCLFFFLLIFPLSLVDWGSDRALSMETLHPSTSLMSFIQNITHYFPIGGERLTLSPPRIAQYASSALVFIVLIRFFVRTLLNRKIVHPELFFLTLGVAGALALSIINVGLPLSSRYFFPPLVFGVVLAGQYFGKKIEKIGTNLSLAIFFLAALHAGIDFKNNWGSVIPNFGALLTFGDNAEPVLIDRSSRWGDQSSWNVLLLGKGHDPAECTGEGFDDLFQFGARIYCGR